MVDAISSAGQYQTSHISSQQESNGISFERQQKLISAGVPQSTIAQGKDAIKTYIKAHPEVKQALHSEKTGAQAQGSVFQPQAGNMSAATTAPGVGSNLDVSA